MHNPVSVVITCYNLENYIGDAIRSALEQDFSGAVEILVIDDCSTDGSRDVIQSYSGVRYIRTVENSGVLLATVLGLSEATHDIVFFLDGDDLWYPDKLRLAAEQFAYNERLGLLTHDLDYIDCDGCLMNKPSQPGQMMGSNPAEYDRLIRDGILLHSNYVWLGSAFAIRKNLVNAEQFCAWAKRLPDPRNTYQDWPLAYWSASRKGVCMGYVPEKLFAYRLHGFNYSGDAGTPVKAVRNVRRTYNTLRAIDEIAKSADLPALVMDTTKNKTRYYGYLLDLYTGRRGRALIGIFASLPWLKSSPKAVAKEVLRFMGVQIFGVNMYLGINRKIKNYKHR